MATKPYPQIEETPSMAKEPAVAYQRTDPATYRDMAPCESVPPTDETASEDE